MNEGVHGKTEVLPVDKEIHKFLIAPGAGIQSVMMPKGAQVLSAQLQSFSIAIWAIVEPQSLMTERKFLLAMTGRTLPKNLMVRFIDTVQMDEGNYVLHLFDVIAQ